MKHPDAVFQYISCNSNRTHTGCFFLFLFLRILDCMTLEFTILIVVIVIGFAGMFWFLARRLSPQTGEEDKSKDQAFLMLQNQMNQLTTTLDSRLSESARMFQNQFSTTAKITQEVTEKLIKLEETNKQVIGFADQLKNLQDILKNPKQRGNLGEYYLETVLKNVLPPGGYQMQYQFKKDEYGKFVTVDAVVFVDKRIIPIDSKFSLENYNRILESPIGSLDRKKYEAAFVDDLKIRINETSKYVKPEEGTMDFAFMFIPSEAIYYDLLVNKVGSTGDDTKNLITHAGQKHVIIVSPTSFLAYLQTVLQGLRNQKISEQAKEIIGQVENLGKHLFNYETFIKKLGGHLGTTVNAFNSAYKELGKIDKDVLRITGDKTGVEAMALTGPEMEE